MPTATLKVNGSESPALIESGQNFSVSIAFDISPEVQSEVYFAYVGPSGLMAYHYPNGWIPELKPIITEALPIGSLADIVLFWGTLPAGVYTFYLVVDSKADAIFTEPFYYDTIQVTVKELVAGFVPELKYVAQLSGYVWHGAVNGDMMLWGKYIEQKGDNPNKPEDSQDTATKQQYLAGFPPYTSFQMHQLKSTGNHESCRPFFLNGRQYLITERGSVFADGNNDSRFIIENRHYLLAACRFNNEDLFAWNRWVGSGAGNPVEGTMLYRWTPSGMQLWKNFFNSGLKTYKMLPFGNDLYLFGRGRDNDNGKIFKVDTNGNSIQLSINGGSIKGFYDGIGYQNNLYGLSGSRDGGPAEIYKLSGNYFHFQGKFSAGINNPGTFGILKDTLFACAVQNYGSAEVRKLGRNGWEVIFSPSDFQALVKNAGTGSGLNQPSGFFVFINSKLYLVLNDTKADRGGPSYLFSIE